MNTCQTFQILKDLEQRHRNTDFKKLLCGSQLRKKIKESPCFCCITVAIANEIPEGSPLIWFSLRPTEQFFMPRSSKTRHFRRLLRHSQPYSRKCLFSIAVFIVIPTFRAEAQERAERFCKAKLRQ